MGFRITDRCNSNCSYCYLKNKNSDELNTDEIKKLINEMADLGVQRIGFMGGEALLRDDFGEIVDYANSKDMHTSLTSNCYLVHSKIDIIKKLDCLILSFDGRKKSHDKNRGRGSFEKVMKAIKVVSKENTPLITISVLSEDSVNDIDYVLNTAKKYGFQCHFNILSKKHLNKNLIRKAIIKLMRRKMEGYPITLSSKTLSYLLYVYENYNPRLDTNQKYIPNCFAGKLMCNIEPSGMLRACNIPPMSEECVDAKKLGFKNAFEKLKIPNCNKCRCSAYAEYNNMFSLNPETIFKWSTLLKIFR